MNNYELTVVFDGKMTAAKKKSAVEKLTKLLTTLKAKVTDSKDMGTRDLAYPINKLESGFYMFYNVEMSADAAKKLSDKMRMEDYMIRHLLIKA